MPEKAEPEAEASKKRICPCCRTYRECPHRLAELLVFPGAKQKKRWRVCNDCAMLAFVMFCGLDHPPIPISPERAAEINGRIEQARAYRAAQAQKKPPANRKSAFPNWRKLI